MARQLARFLRRRKVASAPGDTSACNAARSRAIICRRIILAAGGGRATPDAPEELLGRESRPARPAFGVWRRGRRAHPSPDGESASGLLRASDRVMSGSSLDEYRRFGRSPSSECPLERHRGPHLRRLQLKELSRIPHAGSGRRLSGSAAPAPAWPEGPRPGSQCIIYAQTCSSLHAGLIGNLVNSVLDPHSGLRKENNTHWKHAQVRGNLRSKQLRKGCSFLTSSPLPPANTLRERQSGFAQYRKRQTTSSHCQVQLSRNWLIQPPRPDLPASCPPWLLHPDA